jgi:hypothetical protein
MIMKTVYYAINVTGVIISPVVNRFEAITNPIHNTGCAATYVSILTIPYSFTLRIDVSI